VVDSPDISKLSYSDKKELLELLTAREKLQRERKIFSMYPETGPLSRHEYPKHVSFFGAGQRFNERGAVAANRVGKTEGIGGYELTMHLTGLYPDWWPGIKFDGPVDTWAAGTTNQTTKDIIQYKLLGPVNDMGTGLIPGAEIVDTKKKASSVPDTIETVYVNHYTRGVKDGVSVLGLKSYEQGRKSFEGTEKHIILLDEEPPEDVYGECYLRTMTVDGHILLTFTPMQGCSKVVLMYMPGGKVPDNFEETGKYVIQLDWDDAPHLTKEQKERYLNGIAPHLRDARTRGIPSLGSGAIYPIGDPEIITVDDFKIPDYWHWVYGFDFGWNATAAMWAAVDKDNDITYLTREYKAGFQPPAVHVSAVKSLGEWIPGIADPAGRQSNQKDGSKLIDEYRALGLRLEQADNAVEAGIFDVWNRMSTGRLKVFRSCQKWFDEFRVYFRDEKGKVVKENDHLMDCTRYLVRSGLPLAKQMPVKMFMDKIKKSENEYNPLTYGLGATNGLF
jgi:phage terminase large subunit-like protein